VFPFLLISFSSSFYLFLPSFVPVSISYFHFLPFSPPPFSPFYLLLSPFLNCYAFIHLYNFLIYSLFVSLFLPFQILFPSIVPSILQSIFYVLSILCFSSFLSILQFVSPLLSFSFFITLNFSISSAHFLSSFLQIFLPLCTPLLAIFSTSFPLYLLLYSPVFRLALPPFLTKSPRPHVSTVCVSPPTKSSFTEGISLLNSDLQLFVLFCKTPL
jgi:hypothetical protein